MTRAADVLWRRIRRTMAETLAVDEQDIGLESSPETLPSWDSTMHVSLVLALEEDLGIRFSPDDAAEMLSAELIYLIAKERSAR